MFFLSKSLKFNYKYSSFSLFSTVSVFLKKQKKTINPITFIKKKFVLIPRSFKFAKRRAFCYKKAFKCHKELPSYILKAKKSTSLLGVIIKISQNNLFCTLYSITGSKTIYTLSAGINKTKIFKKRLFFGVKIILDTFLFKIKKIIKKSLISLYRLHVSQGIRKYILLNLSKQTPKPLIQVGYSKAFNGCKVKKRRRKKRLGFRCYK